MERLDQRIAQSLALLAVGVLVLVSWRWGYQASVRAFVQDRHQVATLNERLSQVEAMVQVVGGEAAWRARTEERLAKLKARFPQQAQLPQLLNALVDTLKGTDVKVVNVEQGNVEPVRDGNHPMLIDGTPCFRLPVKVSAEGRYHAVRAALERITGEVFPCVLSIEQVDFHLKETTGAQLDVTLQVSLYVLGSPSVVAPHA